MASPIDQQIRDHIDQFVTDLDALIRDAAIGSVRQALQTDGRARAAPARARPENVPRMGRRRKGEKRDPKVLEHLSERLLAFIAKNSGHRIEEIAKSIGTTTKELALPAKKLIADKKIRTTGQRRATKYFAGRSA